MIQEVDNELLEPIVKKDKKRSMTPGAVQYENTQLSSLKSFDQLCKDFE